MSHRLLTLQKTLRDVQKEHQKQGWLVKRSRHIRKWRRRYVVLKGGAIFTFRSDHDKDANATEKIDLSSFNIVTDATFKKHPHTFNVSSGSRTFSFECVSKAEKDCKCCVVIFLTSIAWKESIQEAVDVARESQIKVLLILPQFVFSIVTLLTIRLLPYHPTNVHKSDDRT